MAANAAIWTKLKSAVDQLPKRGPKNDREVAINDADFARRYYSRAANYWGVELQKAGHLPEAGRFFELARDFNPENWVAWVNQEYNHNLSRGQNRPIELSSAVEGKVRVPNAKYRTWEDRLSADGPFDEPRFCTEMGENFALAKTSLTRLAAQQFIRVQTLDPANVEIQVWLANLYLKWPLPQKALEVVEATEANQNRVPLSLPYQIELIRLRAWALANMTNLNAAVALLRQAQEKHPAVASLPETLSQIYIASGQFTNALEALDEQLRLEPNSLKALLNKGALHIQLNQYALAIPPLTQAMQVEPKNLPVRLNRALAYLRSKQWEPAQRDYQALLDMAPASEQYRIYYGLGETAYHLQNTAQAIKNYELYLKNLPRNAEGAPKQAVEAQIAQTITNRLQELRNGSRPKS
jgi:tetratricopeptide (TPR) repeat protein